MQPLGLEPKFESVSESVPDNVNKLLPLLVCFVGKEEGCPPRNSSFCPRGTRCVGVENGSEKCDCIDTVKTRLVHGNNKFACRTKGKHKHPEGNSDCFYGGI